MLESDEDPEDPDDLSVSTGGRRNIIDWYLDTPLAWYLSGGGLLALGGAGFDYLTDEAAAIDQAGVVRPFPKSIALDPGSFGLFAHLAPPAVGPLAERITRREWHVDPATIGSVGVASEVAAIVCPHWRAGSSTRLARVRGTEALHTLLGEVFDARVGGGAVFSTLARVVERVPVYRLGYGDLDEAVAVIGRLAA